MKRKTRGSRMPADRVFDFAQMFNRLAVLDEEIARRLPAHEFELSFDERGGIYVDGKALGVNVRRRYRALRPTESRRS